MTPPYIAENTLSGSPTNILPRISRYGGKEQEHHQELLKIAGEHWKNRHLYDHEANLKRDYFAYTGTGEIRASYPVLSLVGTGIGKAGLWAGRKVLGTGALRAGRKAPPSIRIAISPPGALRAGRKAGEKTLLQFGSKEKVRIIAIWCSHKM